MNKHDESKVEFSPEVGAFFRKHKRREIVGLLTLAAVLFELWLLGDWLVMNNALYCDEGTSQLECVFRRMFR